MFSLVPAHLSRYVVLDTSIFCSRLCIPPHSFDDGALALTFNQQRHIFQFTYPTNMHPHKIVAQILLIFSILNSVLAAPIVRVRGEIPGARGAVAVRVPSGGVVAVLEKRPYPNTPTGTNLPDLIDFSSPEPSPSTSHELQPPTSPQHSEFQSPTGGHPGFRPLTSPEHPEFQSTRPPGPEEVSGPIHVASPKEIYRPVTENKAPSMPAWREKIMTPEKIKATKYIAGAALFTTLYLGLLLPDIFRDDNKHSQS